MERFLCDVISSQLFVVVLECPPHYFRHMLSCYNFSNETRTWIDAERHCVTSHPRAHLLAIENKAEEGFILSFRQHNEGLMSCYQLNIKVCKLYLFYRFSAVEHPIHVGGCNIFRACLALEVGRHTARGASVLQLASWRTGST